MAGVSMSNRRAGTHRPIDNVRRRGLYASRTILEATRPASSGMLRSPC